MNSELQKLFEFQLQLIEMQRVLTDLQIAGAPKETIEKGVKRIDSLIEIYNHFDKFYYQRDFYFNKCVSLEIERSKFLDEIGNLKAENEKLIKSLEW